MKSVVLGLGITMCGIFGILIVMTLSGISIRRNELQDAVELALHDTVENQMNPTTKSATSNEEFIADFKEALKVQIVSDGSITVRVLGVDFEKGLLSVEVKSQFKHIIGTTGEVVVKRTVIQEQYKVEP